jgi:hypothetical protein
MNNTLQLARKNVQWPFCKKKHIVQWGNKKCFATKICFMYLYALQMNTITSIYLLLCLEDV